MDYNFDQARNLKLILTAFEKLSGLKINFHKVKISASVKPKSMNCNMKNYSDVRKTLTLSDILEFLCIIES
jgi:hypothetical protein